MFHPEILRQLQYRIREQQMYWQDACMDTAQFYGINTNALVTFYLAIR